jgi:hypothetical protein
MKIEIGMARTPGGIAPVLLLSGGESDEEAALIQALIARLVEHDICLLPDGPSTPVPVEAHGGKFVYTEVVAIPLVTVGEMRTRVRTARGGGERAAMCNSNN